MCVGILLVFLTIHSTASAQQDTMATKDDDQLAKGLLIFAYVCFALGAVLIVVGFARLIWWAWMVKKHGTSRRQLANHSFYSYYKDPWLRAPSMASLASGSRLKPSADPDSDSLRVDTDAIYAQPIDATPRALYLHAEPEPELSQTESQIYAEAANGNGSDGGHHVYSVPQKQGSRGVPVTSIDEEPADPGLPARRYGNDVSGSLAEADRSSMREISYVEPPADYSPSRGQSAGRSAESRGTTGDATRSRREADRPTSGGPRELSGSDLCHTAVFKDSSGSEVNRFTVAPPNGSLKSMKSLYQYMATNEPCALEDEINYTFVSSFH